jgi:hypothetical protein
MNGSMAGAVIEFMVTFLPWLVSTAAMCGAVYMGIRKDLARAIEDAKEAKESAGEAHNRIDELQQILINR